MVLSRVNSANLSRFQVVKGADGFWEVLDKLTDRVTSVCFTRDEGRIKANILDDFHSNGMHYNDFLTELTAASLMF